MSAHGHSWCSAPKSTVGRVSRSPGRRDSFIDSKPTVHSEQLLELVSKQVDPWRDSEAEPAFASRSVLNGGLKDGFAGLDPDEMKEL